MDYYYTNENEFIVVYERIETFKNKTKTRKSVISTFVTTNGVKENNYSSVANIKIVLNDFLK